MNPLSVVEACDQNRIRLFLVDGELRFRCSRGAMPDALLDLLREHRDTLPITIRLKLLERLADFDRDITRRMPWHMRHDSRLQRLGDAAYAAVRSCDSMALEEAIQAIERLITDAFDALTDRGPDIWPASR